MLRALRIARGELRNGGSHDGPLGAHDARACRRYRRRLAALAALAALGALEGEDLGEVRALRRRRFARGKIQS
jgi:hypothetical protein